jgi:pyridoxamine 5'-phosphate oxidase
VASRAALEGALAEVEARYPDVVPRPPYWGGYVVRPDTVELWKGRRNRLHDRLRYRRDGDAWVIERLAP